MDGEPGDPAFCLYEDRSHARLTKTALDEQIDATVANESKLLEEFGKAISIKEVQVADAGKIIAEYDKIWLPKAPVLAELRKVGAAL